MAYITPLRETSVTTPFTRISPDGTVEQTCIDIVCDTGKYTIDISGNDVSLYVNDIESPGKQIKVKCQPVEHVRAVYTNGVHAHALFMKTDQLLCFWFVCNSSNITGAESTTYPVNQLLANKTKYARADVRTFRGSQLVLKETDGLFDDCMDYFTPVYLPVDHIGFFTRAQLMDKLMEMPWTRFQDSVFAKPDIVVKRMMEPRTGLPRFCQAYQHFAEICEHERVEFGTDRLGAKSKSDSKSKSK